jgi:hypothetical protein
LLLRNDSAANMLFTDVAHSMGVDDTGSGFSACWGDYDNDEDLDLFMCNVELGSHRLFRNDGVSGFTDVTTSAGILTQSGWAGGGWLDVDNDGYLDLLVVTYAASNLIYRNIGDGTFVIIYDPPLSTSSHTSGIAGADFDADGDVDLFYNDGTQAAGYHSHLLENTYGAGNHWLHLHLIGNMQLPPPFSNRSAVGARVRVVADVDGMPPAETQIREVCADGNSLLVEFGLGQATSIDLIEVRWPSGRVQEETNVPWLDQTIVWLEGHPSTTVETELQPTLALRLHQNRPNPFNPETVIHYDLPGETTIEITVFDVAGRRVRVLQPLAVIGAGRHAVRWDGRDGRGQQVSSGVYFYRIEALDWSQTRSMVLLK